MTKKDILKAAEDNMLNYCMHRGVAKVAFIDGALWAMKRCREILQESSNELNIENDEEEMQ